MSTTLTTITTQYHKFNKNQVLTEKQLNEFLDYFKDQDHLSRLGLSGVGIVCGFELTYNSLSKTIDITQGYGVTTDGDLLTLQNPLDTDEGKEDTTLKSIDLIAKTFTHYKKYENAQITYSKFVNGEEPIDLWEIKPEAEITDSDGIIDSSYEALTEFTGLENMVVLLYLENYSKEGDLCTALTCDNQGIEQVARLKVLLVDPNDALYITSESNDPIYNEHNWFEINAQLPELKARRVILSCENTQTFSQLKKNYFDGIDKPGVLAELGDAYDLILKKFNSEDTIKPTIDSFFSFSKTAVPLDFQYRYDLLKDLIDTYNDIRELLLKINVHCCPNIGSFPKHLMLGRLVETQPYKTLRHRFYKSPIIGVEDYNYKRLLSLVERAKELVEKYKETDKGEEIKITPSQEHGILERKAIPFYYNVANGLIDHWSYDRYLNFTQKNNLSYHSENLAETAQVQRPLFYCMDNNDFYRIEGHQGKLYQDALDQILKMKKDHGLNFDVKVLSIDPSTKEIDIDDYRCEFEDLAMLQDAWITEQNCILEAMAEFFSGFKVDEVGGNIVADSYGVGRVPIVPDAAFDIAAPAATPTWKRPRKAYKYNAVKEKLTKDNNAIGFYINKAIEENPKGSANDIKYNATYEINQVIDQDAWAEKPDVQEFVIGQMIDIVSVTWELAERIPNSLSDIDALKINTYNLSLDDVCELVDELEITYRTVDLSDTLKDILAVLINQLATICCSGKKLEILLEEIQERKERVLKQIQLAEFVKKHPGLEHKAGVPMGGTFVMAYITENTSDQPTYESVTMELIFLEQPNIDDDGLDGDEGIITLWNDSVSTKFAFLPRYTSQTQNKLSEVVIIGETIPQTVENFAVFLNERWEIANATRWLTAEASGDRLKITIKDRTIPSRDYFIQFYNERIIGSNQKQFFDANNPIYDNISSKNTVVADFALPYMCCSDCSPINFIVPKEPAFLSLPVTHICLDETTEPIPFTVSPEDGEVKAVVEDGVNGGVIQNDEGAYFFDANQLDPSLYGTEISFTVDDEETTAKITVYNAQGLSVTRSVNYNSGNTQATVIFKVIGDVSDINSFTWNLGDGSTSNAVPNTDGLFTHVYNLPVNDDNAVEPTLEVTNGPCSTIITIPPIKFEDPIDVNLTIQETICIDSEGDNVSVPFSNLNPTDGEIALADPDVEGMNINGTNLVIVPGDFEKYNEPIAFTVNELATGANITVFAKLQIGIGQDSGGFIWNEAGELEHSYWLGTQLPDAVNEDELMFEWTIDGTTVGTEKNLNYRFPINEGTNSFAVVTKVTDPNGCVAEASITVTIDYPEFSLSLPGNVLDYCLDDTNEYLVTISPSIFGTTVAGAGIGQNSDGDIVFVPANSGLTSGQSVHFAIDGNVLLIVNLHEPAVASFTPTQVGNQIILQNESTGDIVEYTWFVNGVAHATTSGENHIIDLTPNSPTEWTFRLEVRSEQCGTDSTDDIPFTATIVPDVTCLDTTEARIVEDKGAIPTIPLPTEIDQLRTNTVALYDTVIERADEYLKGVHNDSLEFLFVNLIDSTVQAMRVNAQNPEVNKELSQLLILQIKLFYNILHCQEADVLNNSLDKINSVQDQIRSGLALLREIGFEFDVNDELTNFLNDCIENSDLIDEIKQFIKNELLPRIL